MISSLKLRGKSWKRIYVRKKNSSPSFGSKQPVFLPTVNVAKTPPKLNRLLSKVFALSKTVTGLTKAATG